MADAAPLCSTRQVMTTATTTGLSVSPVSLVVQGTRVTLTATITPATAVGTVQFKDGTTNLGNAVTVSNGTASGTTSGLAVGSRQLTAVFIPSNPAAFSSSAAPVVIFVVITSTQAVARVRLLRLACQQTEDSTGPDEAYLKINGETVFGPVSINDGQTANIGISIPFDVVARVELFDEDSPDSDDPLGVIIISEDEAGTGEKAQDFKEEGASYTLFYAVEATAPPERPRLPG